MHQHLLAPVEQYDRLAHGLQDRQGTVAGAGRGALGIQALAHLPAQQQGHQAQQQDLGEDRGGAQPQRLMAALLCGGDA